MDQRQQIRKPLGVGGPISERTLHKISLLTISDFRKMAKLVICLQKHGDIWNINSSSQDFHFVRKMICFICYNIRNKIVNAGAIQQYR